MCVSVSADHCHTFVVFAIYRPRDQQSQKLNVNIIVHLFVIRAALRQIIPLFAISYKGQLGQLMDVAQVETARIFIFSLICVSKECAALMLWHYNQYKQNNNKITINSLKAFFTLLFDCVTLIFILNF